MHASALDRRSWLRTVGTAALGLAANGACAGGSAASPFVSGPPSRRSLARVLVSPDRVVRTVTGLRPYRPSGFVVRGERCDAKVIIHNYGHGGAGITLSWGTARLAVDEALHTGQRSAAVLGCGAVGLATARLLQQHGWAVTIYARELPPDTTSNVAGAQWAPSVVVDENYLTPRFEAQYLRAARVAHRTFQELAGGDYGVRWLPAYRLELEPRRAGRLELALADLFPDARELERGEHPFRAGHVRRFATMLIEPNIYLAAVLRDFLLARGELVVRELRSVQELMSLPEPVVVNCTGLGARALFGDAELTPIKGQLCVLRPQPEVDYVVSAADDLYMMPRRDGIVLGGSHELGAWDPAPDPTVTHRILGRTATLFE